MKYTVLESLIPNFESKLNKFQKKFAKYGADTLMYEKGQPYIVTSQTSPFYLKSVVDIEVSGSYKVGDYEFVASLEWNSQAQQNVIKSKPGEGNIPEKYRTSCNCEHCHTNRARKSTTILKDKDGNYIQVGNSCLSDYLGQSIISYADYLSLFTSLQEYLDTNMSSGLRSTPSAYEVQDILMQTCADVNRRGYKSHGDCLSEADYYENIDFSNQTSRRIYRLIVEDKDINGKLSVPRYKDNDLTDSDRALYERVRNFVTTLDDTSDYNHNLIVLNSVEYITLKDLGLVVSMVGYYLREVKKLEEQEASKLSDYVGNVGERIEFQGTPSCIWSADSLYGITYMYKFTVKGNVFVWTTSTYLNTNKQYTVKGTVKEHAEFKGTKQTVLTRCRVA